MYDHLLRNMLITTLFEFFIFIRHIIRHDISRYINPRRTLKYAFAFITSFLRVWGKEFWTSEFRGLERIPSILITECSLGPRLTRVIAPRDHFFSPSTTRMAENRSRSPFPSFDEAQANNQRLLQIRETLQASMKQQQETLHTHQGRINEID